jgi:hypothetical protein
MDTINTTSREQFVTDYTLVVDNDFDAYREIMDKPETDAKNVSGLSDVMKAEFETYISQVVEREQEAGRTVGALLISQMLTGWGVAPWDDIARHYIGLKTEQEVA